MLSRAIFSHGLVKRTSARTSVKRVMPRQIRSYAKKAKKVDQADVEIKDQDDALMHAFAKFMNMPSNKAFLEIQQNAGASPQDVAQLLAKDDQFNVKFEQFLASEAPGTSVLGWETPTNSLDHVMQQMLNDPVIIAEIEKNERKPEEIISEHIVRDPKLMDMVRTAINTTPDRNPGGPMDTLIREMVNSPEVMARMDKSTRFSADADEALLEKMREKFDYHSTVSALQQGEDIIKKRAVKRTKEEVSPEDHGRVDAMAKEVMVDPVLQAKLSELMKADVKDPEAEMVKLMQDPEIAARVDTIVNTHMSERPITKRLKYMETLASMPNLTGTQGAQFDPANRSSLLEILPKEMVEKLEQQFEAGWDKRAQKKKKKTVSKTGKKLVVKKSSKKETITDDPTTTTTTTCTYELSVEHVAYRLLYEKLKTCLYEIPEAPTRTQVYERLIEKYQRSQMPPASKKKSAFRKIKKQPESEFDSVLNQLFDEAKRLGKEPTSNVSGKMLREADLNAPEPSVFDLNSFAFPEPQVRKPKKAEPDTVKHEIGFKWRVEDKDTVALRESQDLLQILTSYDVEPAMPVASEIVQEEPVQHRFAEYPTARADYQLGVLTLPPKEWSVDLRDKLIVHYALRGDQGLAWGMLRRAKGNNWVIVDPTLKEETIDKYAIKFVYPSAWLAPLNERVRGDHLPLTLESFAEILQNQKARMELLTKNPEEIWERYYALDEGGVAVPLRDLTAVLFKKPYAAIEAKDVLAAHLYLCKHAAYFQANSRRGWKLGPLAMAQIRMKVAAYKAEHEKTFEAFCKKAMDVLDDKRYGDGQLRLHSLLDADDIRILTSLTQFALSGSEEAEAELARRVLEPLGCSNMPHDAYQLLVELGVLNKNDNPHVLRFVDFPLQFSETDMEAAKTCIADLPEEASQVRTDLRSMPVFTIDDANPHEVDDGISIHVDDEGRDWVYVHISDVSHAVSPQSFLDYLAGSRARTVYTPERHFSMLPAPITDYCSLTGDTTSRKVVTFAARIGYDGHLEGWRIFLSTIQKIVPMTFDDLDLLLTGSQVHDLSDRLLQIKSEHEDALDKLYEMAQRRRSVRMNANAAVAYMPTPKVQVVGQGDRMRPVVTITPNPHRGARGIVTEMMLMAGQVAAEFATKFRIPVLYSSQISKSKRVHREFDRAEFSDFYRGVKERPFANLAIQIESIKALSATRYNIQPMRHSGFGMNRFVSITSPLRRYVDLLNMHNLKAALARQSNADRKFTTEFPYSFEDLSSKIPHLETLSETVKDLENKATRYWVLESMRISHSSNASRKFSGIILQMPDKRGVGKVILTDNGLQTDADLSKHVPVGTQVELVVDAVSPFYDKIAVSQHGAKYGSGSTPM